VRVVIVDNFDSFTYNLAQAFGALGADVHVVRNDVDARVALAILPDRLVLSPGPGGPARTGSCREIVAGLQGRIPILGVCLGMQLLATIEGARVVRATRPVHGRATPLEHDGLGIYRGLPSPCEAGRYHSLAVDPASLPPSLVPTAWSGGVLMGLRHARLAVEGIQFHPESVLTPHGAPMLANFLEQR
jgi:anthranilate synthase/aminodeoxychorismate synthase-like glutamine amidotransferase